MIALSAIPVRLPNRSGLYRICIQGKYGLLCAYSSLHTNHHAPTHTMASVSSISLSGMNAAQTRLDSAAHNVANTETTPFRRQEVIQIEQKDGGVSTALGKSSVEGAALETDMVAQLQAKNTFLANLAVFKTSNQMAGALLDQKA
nr:flagellar basal body protein [Rhodoferax sp.]